jgi:hypothetical protein
VVSAKFVSLFAEVGRLVIAVDDEDTLELSEFELGLSMIVDAPFLGAVSPIVARASVIIGAAEPCVT